jgi:hypothetical protein
MSKGPLSIISSNDISKFLEFESYNLLRNIQLLNSVQYFLNKHFQEFMQIRKQNIPVIEFTLEEKNEMAKWFDPKTTHDEVKDKLMDLAIKLSQINREETDIPKFIRNMSLTYLVSNFEDFFAKCLLHYFQLEPKALLSSRNKAKGEHEKTVTYNDILQCNNQKEIVEKLIQKELDIIMREDIDKIIQYFQNLLKTKIDDANDFGEFIEIFDRRNCIIHHQGYANSNYKRKNKLDEKTPIELVTDHDYLQKSFKRIIVYSENIKTVILEKVTKSSSLP